MVQRNIDVRNAVIVGKELRKEVKRGEHGHWDASLRKRQPEEILAAASRNRIPSLLKIKQARMDASPFAFYRGAAALMAYDLSLTASTGITTQLCGDAHIHNLGAYAGIDGKLIFDINDFDETCRGPFEWDVKRMAASIFLAGQSGKLNESDCALSATAFLESYSALIHTLSGLPVLDVARYQVRRLKAAPPLAKILAKAERASPLHLRDKLTKKHNGKRIFLSDPPLQRRIQGQERHLVLASLSVYRESLLPERRHFFDQYQPIDVAFKVVGTGAVGLRDYCIYMEGNGSKDPLILQLKQQVRSVYTDYVPKTAAPHRHQGQRAADGQRAMQLQSDPLLGWTRFGGHDYLVRQLNDHKASLDVTTLRSNGLAAYSSVCGEMLARGHARAGDARVIAGYIGHGNGFTEAILQFAAKYAAQTSEDWKHWRKDVSPSKAAKKIATQTS